MLKSVSGFGQRTCSNQWRVQISFESGSIYFIFESVVKCILNNGRMENRDEKLCVCCEADHRRHTNSSMPIGGGYDRINFPREKSVMRFSQFTLVVFAKRMMMHHRAIVDSRTIWKMKERKKCIAKYAHNTFRIDRVELREWKRGWTEKTNSEWQVESM